MLAEYSTQILFLRNFPTLLMVYSNFQENEILGEHCRFATTNWNLTAFSTKTACPSTFYQKTLMFIKAVHGGVRSREFPARPLILRIKKSAIVKYLILLLYRTESIFVFGRVAQSNVPAATSAKPRCTVSVIVLKVTFFSVISATLSLFLIFVQQWSTAVTCGTSLICILE